MLRLKLFKKFKNARSGNTLISVLFFMIVLALIAKPAIDYYDAWKDHKAVADTAQRLADINAAVRNYAAANGRYPCPAPMTAEIDTKQFGVEAASECDTGTGSLTTRSAGQDGLFVRAGAVPVRTLGLSDDHMYDGYRHRYVYTVTEKFAAQKPDLQAVSAAIRIVDQNKNTVTQKEGNVVFAVMSMGEDMNGAYSDNGKLIQACDASKKSGENCNMDATLLSSLNKSSADGSQKFTQNILFQTGAPCVNTMTAPKTMAYLLDTSGSMTTKAPCPPNYGNNCTRMDAAQWAMRRALASRQAQTLNQSDYTTDFTGFVGDQKSSAQKLINADISVAPTDNFENKLKNACPSGNTPLGEHIAALAEKIGPGESVDHPNAILVVSDGESNVGQSPLAVAQNIYKQYGGKLIVHIVDMGNNPGLAAIAKATSPNAKEGQGGQYFSTTDPQKLKDWLLKLSGTCEETDVPEPTDYKNCH